MLELFGWLALTLLGLKTIWNLIIPYVLAKDIIVGGSEESRKVSLFLLLEWACVVYLLISKTPSTVVEYIGNYQRFAICIILIVLLSYVHFFVVGIISVGLRKMYDFVKSRAR
jgi:hypothetical protein